MSEQLASLQSFLRSPVEEQVLSGLQQLPPEYKILAAARIQIPEVPGGESTVSYTPDFEVCGPDGSRVVIAVKTDASLSMVALSRFIKLNELINAAGKSLLVLVWGNERFTPRLSRMPEFEALHIQPVHSGLGVV